MNKTFVEITKKAEPYIEALRQNNEAGYAFDSLLEVFDPIVKSVVKSVKHGSSIDDEDLYQEATIALWKCCSKYDPDKNASFYTYFYGTALNALYNYVYVNQGSIQVNKHEKYRTKQLRDFAKEYNEVNDKWPDIEDYVSFGFDRETAERFCMLSVNMYSSYDNADSLTNCPSNENHEEIENLHFALSMIDEGVAKVVKMRYIDGYTYNEIAKRLNITIREVKRRETYGLQRLRELME